MISFRSLYLSIDTWIQGIENWTW